jgi:PKD repeat protein
MANIYKSLLGKSMGLLGVAMLLLCFSNTSFAQLSGNLTIDKNSPASATNFTSFQALFTALSSQGVNGPVTVDVSNGPYTERVSANSISGASSTNTITINGNGQVLQYTATSSSNRHTIRFNGTDWVTLKNLTIRGLGTTYAWGIRYYNNANNNTVDGCTIEIPNMNSTSNRNSAGICATSSTTSLTSTGNNCRNLTVTNCTITGGATRGPYYGIVLYSQFSDGTTANHKITNNTIKNFRYHGVRLSRTGGAEIEDNDFYRDNGYNWVTTTYVVYVERSRNIDVRRNKIHAMFHSNQTNTFGGIYFTFNSSSSGSHEISNNLIYDNNSRSTWYGIFNSCTRNMDISYNTISHQTATPLFGTQYGLFVQCSYGGRSFKNNIINLDMPGSTTRIGIYHWSSTMDIDHNNIHVTGTNGNIARLQGAYLKTPAQWQAATGNGAPFDANSSFVDPDFISITDGNQLIPRAIAIDDIGTPITGITEDIGSNARSVTTPDPGGHEFKIDANVSSVTSVGGVLSCQGETDEVEVVIKNDASFPIKGFTVTYKATGANPKVVTEPFTGTIGAGMTANFTFAEKLDFTNTGNTDVTAYIGKKPEVGPHTIATNPSPIGAEFTKGSVFQGNFLTGNNTDPDITANPDEVNYELTPPTGFNNSDYGTTWNISTYITSTAKGANIPAGNIVRTNPIGSANLKLSVKPAASLTDDTLIINIAAFSIATQCEAPILDRYIFVAPRPVADYNALDVCEGDAVQFVNASTISTGTISYSWDFGDGTTSDFADFNKVYNGFGTYTVELTVESNYGYTDVITKTVEVFEAPKVDFTFDNKCEGDIVPFTDASTVPGGSPVYAWDFGDGNTSSTQSPSYTYSAPKVYMASLTITDAKGCTSTETKAVTYSPRPTADFTVPTLACNENDVLFTNTSTEVGNTGYVWDFDFNNQSAQTKNGSVKYTNAGIYNVKLTALSDFGCADSKTIPVTITEGPVADFTTPGGCTGDQIMFTNTTSEPAGANTTYEWSFGEDGAISTSKDDSYTYNSVGDYEVILKASADNGCATEKKITVTMGERPVVDFTLPEKACVGEMVNITNSSVVSSGSLSSTWDLGNSTTSTANNPTVTYNTAGNFTVMLEAESGVGCKDSKSRTIVVNEIPNSDFNFESAKTGDGRMTFTPIAPNGTGNYKWIYGDGGTSVMTGQHNYVYTSPVGLFKVTLIIDNDGCTSTTTKDVLINTLSVRDIIEGKLQVYPNPTSGNITINIDGVEGVNKLTVVDMLGKAVASQATNSAASAYNFDLTSQSAGIYFVQVHTNGGVFSKKVTLTK